MLSCLRTCGDVPGAFDGGILMPRRFAPLCKALLVLYRERLLLQEALAALKEHPDDAA